MGHQLVRGRISRLGALVIVFASVGCGRIGFESPLGPNSDASGDAAGADASGPDAAGLDATASDAAGLDAAASDAGTDAGRPVGLGGGVACGDAHSCAVVDGALYCWGAGADGRLGLGTADDHATPQLVMPPTGWGLPTAAAATTCAVREDGGVRCWGDNLHGQLGQGDTTARNTPTPVPLPEAMRTVDGINATMFAVAESGALYGWGWDAENEFGQSEPVSFFNRELSPIRVEGPTLFQSASVGQGHVLVVTAGGELWGSGRNTESQLGLGPGGPGQQTSYIRVGSAAWRSVASGQGHSCGIRAAGEIYCWGGNGDGRLGVGDTDPREAPAEADARTDWRTVDVNTFHTCGIRGRGELFCWGRNAEGQLGLGDRTERLTPTRVGTEDDWDYVSTGRFHTCAQNLAGEVFCMGQGGSGQLGDGATSTRDVATPVDFGGAGG